MSASKDSSVSAHAFVESASDPTMVICGTCPMGHGRAIRTPAPTARSSCPIGQKRGEGETSRLPREPLRTTVRRA
jgi:hypothetical protein